MNTFKDGDLVLCIKNSHMADRQYTYSYIEPGKFYIVKQVKTNFISLNIDETLIAYRHECFIKIESRLDIGDYF